MRSHLSELPLQFGDALLMDGTAASVTALRTEPGLLVLNDTGLTEPRIGLRPPGYRSSLWLQRSS